MIKMKKRHRENYITPGLRAVAISQRQKVLARDAILWLLKKHPHSEEDIAEHFGLPQDLVAMLVRELERAGRVVRTPGPRPLLRAQDPLGRWGCDRNLQAQDAR